MRKYILCFILAIIMGCYANKVDAIPMALDLGTALPLNTSTVPLSLYDTVANQNDIKLYSFNAFAGDSLIADIDGGYNGEDGFQAGTDVDTILALFDSSGNLLAQNDDKGSPIDDGSFANNPINPIYTSDPYLAYSMSATGLYYLSVSVNANYFVTDPDVCGVLGSCFTGNGLSEFSQGGDYTLILSGITPVPEPSTLVLFVLGLLSTFSIYNKSLFKRLKRI